MRLVQSDDKGIQICSSGWRVRRDLGRKELGQGGTWDEEGAAWDIDSQGGGANGFCVYARKGETARI